MNEFLLMASGGLIVMNCDHANLSKNEPKDLLARNQIVTISGSNFFRSPLHCAAVLVPPEKMRSLKGHNEDHFIKNSSLLSELTPFFGKSEFPKEL